MDAQSIRLLLLAVGVVVVVGIYLWDRFERIFSRFPGSRDEKREQMRRESPLNQEPESADDILFGSSSQTGQGLETEDIRFDAYGSNDYLHRSEDKIPTLLLQIYLRGHEPLRGEAVLWACQKHQLKPGAMDIFHFSDDERPDQTWFSVASLVEPGTFPWDDLDDFETPGLVLFTELPGVRDGTQIYLEMYNTAERLADELDAQLLDETRSVFTKQTLEHTREKIREHKRQVQLARSGAGSRRL